MLQNRRRLSLPLALFMAFFLLHCYGGATPRFIQTAKAHPLEERRGMTIPENLLLEDAPRDGNAGIWDGNAGANWNKTFTVLRPHSAGDVSALFVTQASNKSAMITTEATNL